MNLKRSNFSSHLVCLLADGDRASDLSGSTSIDDAGAPDQIADDAEGVVHAALGLVNDLREETSQAKPKNGLYSKINSYGTSEY